MFYYTALKLHAFTEVCVKQLLKYKPFYAIAIAVDSIMINFAKESGTLTRGYSYRHGNKQGIFLLSFDF